MTTIPTPPIHHHVNLSSMPIEIKERIAYWVQHLPPAIQKPQKRASAVYHDDDDEKCEDHQEIRRRRKFQQRNDSLALIDVLSLASFDSIFYKICYPLSYKWFDFQAYSVTKMRSTLEEIIRRDSGDVENIQCRVSRSTLDQCKELWNGTFHRPIEWYPEDDPRSRTEVLLDILGACPHLKQLDLDLNPEYFIPTEGSEISDTNSSTSHQDDQMPNLSFQPIAQLTLLTHLALSSPMNRRSYTEPFLLDIISNLSQLQSFACSRIKATHPNPPENPTERLICRSPLGLHLASLPHLVELDLEKAECLDSSWNQLIWKGSLEALSLVDCERVSLSVLHGFIKIFESSLRTLLLYYLPYGGFRNRDSLLQDLKNDKFRLKLPKLAHLYIANDLPIRFLRAFQPLQNLSSLSIGDTPCYSHQDIHELLQDQIWPNLKKLEITNLTSKLSLDEIEKLRDLCQEYGIVMNFDNDDGDDDLEFDEDEEATWKMDHWLIERPDVPGIRRTQRIRESRRER